MQKIKVEVLMLENYDQSFPLPKYETQGAAGLDVRAMHETKGEWCLRPFERMLIPTGLKMSIPHGYEMQVRPRSGLSLKTGLLVVNSPGTVDSDYRGEVKIIIGNLSQKDEIIKHGDRIAQLIFSPVTKGEFVVVDELDETARGAGGFGSTGRK